jgi:hypothetical protein
MSDLWDEEGLGGASPGGDGDDWEEGDESAEGELEDAFDDPDGKLDDEDWEDEGDGES